MTKNCRNCRRPFSAKNALFCSMSCYKFYTDALERKDTSIENNKQIERINGFTISKMDQINCNHEYSKNGTMSCRKCGHASVLIR